MLQLLFSLLFQLPVKALPKGGGGYGGSSYSSGSYSSGGSSYSSGSYSSGGYNSYSYSNTYPHSSYSSRGASLSTWAIMAIILGVFVLIIIVWGIEKFCNSSSSESKKEQPQVEPPLFGQASAIQYSLGQEYDSKRNTSLIVPMTDSQIALIKKEGRKAWSFPVKIKKGGTGEKRKFAIKSNGQDVSISSTIQLTNTVNYFEVTIILKPKATTVIAVGVCTANYPTFRLCGWNLNSVGFHSDDGRVFHNDPVSGGKEYDVSFVVGDVVGCGVVDGNVFFTKNGRHLGVAVAGFNHHSLFANVGSDGVVVMSYNFGELPFLYGEMNK